MPRDRTHYIYCTRDLKDQVYYFDVPYDSKHPVTHPIPDDLDISIQIISNNCNWDLIRQYDPFFKDAIECHSFAEIEQHAPTVDQLITKFRRKKETK